MAFILEKCFEEFTKKHYKKITKKLDILEEDVKEAITEMKEEIKKSTDLLIEKIKETINQHSKDNQNIIIVITRMVIIIRLALRDFADFPNTSRYCIFLLLFAALQVLLVF